METTLTPCASLWGLLDLRVPTQWELGAHHGGSSVQLLSRVRLFAARQVSPVHHQLPKPAQTHVHRVGDAIMEAGTPNRGVPL